MEVKELRQSQRMENRSREECGQGKNKRERVERGKQEEVTECMKEKES